MIMDCSWYKVVLTYHQAGFGSEWRDLQNEFARKKVNGMSQTACMLSRDIGLDGVELYFSPESIPNMIITLERYGATPCDTPPEDARGLVFSERV